METLASICRATGASADWLLGLTDRPEGSSPAGETSASYGSAVATNRSTATVAPSADTGRLVEIIAAQQRTIDRLAASITGDKK